MPCSVSPENPANRVLKLRTEELYRGLLRNHLLPFFGNVRLADIDEAAVRRWRKERLDAGPVAPRPFGPVTVAKAYRLMHAIYTTAVEDDRLVRRNPCRIEGAGKEVPRARSCAGRTSGRSGTRHGRRLALPNLHFHDLRHLGGTLAAATGASLKELMARLGHSSTRAALIYQHATRDRDQAIAQALGSLAREVRNPRPGVTPKAAE